MKLLLVFALLLTGCFAADEQDLFSAATKNLTVSEIKALPADVTFKAIQERLRYYTGCEIAIPLISFEIEGEKERDCMMLFEDKTEHLLYAWAYSRGSNSAEDALVLWPQKFAGKKLSDLADEIEKKKRANQALVPTTPSVTPAANAPVAPAGAAAHL
jgi:gamma-glutamylcysteine synthetase